MVPVRALGEALGAHVEWYTEGARVILQRAGRVVEYRIGERGVTVRGLDCSWLGARHWELPYAPYIEAGLSFVPLISVTKGLGLNAGAECDPATGYLICRIWTLERRAALAVTAVPPGALVFLDGVARGILAADPTHPGRSLALTLGDLAPGPHLVRIELKGYECWEEAVDLRPGLNRLEVALTPGNRGRLRVITEPPGAAVFADGRSVGRTPLGGAYLSPGLHALRIRHAGREWEGKVQIFPPAEPGGVIPGDLTVVLANLASGWVAVRHPEPTFALGLGGPWGWDPVSGNAVFVGRGIRWADPDTLEPRRVLDEEVWGFAGWSPGGAYLAFDNGRSIILYDGTGTRKLGEWSMDALGIPSFDGGRGLLRWLPDGRLLGVSEAEWFARYWTLSFAGGPGGPPRCEVLPLSRPEEEFPGYRFQPVEWLEGGEVVVRAVSYAHKDGRREYTTEGFFGDIGIWNERTGELRLLTDAAEGEFYDPAGVVRLPDGRCGIAYRSWRPAGSARALAEWGLLVRDAGGGTELVPVTAPGEARWVSWAPDGGAALLATEDGAIMAMEWDGTGKRLLFRLPASGGARPECDPGKWAPDARRFFLRTADDHLWWLRRTGSPR